MAAKENGRAKRFLFNDELDNVLLDHVFTAQAHVSKYGEVEKAFEGVTGMFCVAPAVVKAMEGGAPVPKVKTVRERFKNLVKKRRQSLDDEKKVDAARKEKALSDAAEEIRSMAVKRGVPVSDSDDAGTSRKKVKKQAKVALEVQEDTELKMLEEDVKARRENEAKRLELDERRLSLDEKRLRWRQKSVKRTRLYFSSWLRN
eukprot:IDg22710t1